MARDRGEFQPRRQILIYPATASDHSDTSPFASIRENGTGYLLTAKRVQDYMDLYIRTDDDRQGPLLCTPGCPESFRAAGYIDYYRTVRPPSRRRGSLGAV